MNGPGMKKGEKRKERRGERGRLTQPKENPGREDGIDPSPEEPGLGPPVPLVRAELPVRDDVDEGNVDGVVGVTRQDDALGAQPRRRDLGHDRVHHRPDGEVGRRAQQDHERARRPCLGCARR